MSKQSTGSRADFRMLDIVNVDQTCQTSTTDEVRTTFSLLITRRANMKQDHNLILEHSTASKSVSNQRIMLSNAVERSRMVESVECCRTLSTQSNQLNAVECRRISRISRMLSGVLPTFRGYHCTSAAFAHLLGSNSVFIALLGRLGSPHNSGLLASSADKRALIR